jgi:hypothetical protein
MRIHQCHLSLTFSRHMYMTRGWKCHIRQIVTTENSIRFYYITISDICVALFNLLFEDMIGTADAKLKEVDLTRFAL